MSETDKLQSAVIVAAPQRLIQGARDQELVGDGTNEHDPKPIAVKKFQSRDAFGVDEAVQQNCSQRGLAGFSPIVLRWRSGTDRVGWLGLTLHHRLLKSDQ